MDVKALWHEVLGEDADACRSFTENSGDSYQAVLLATRAFELWEVELDYLDVLEAESAEALQRLAEHISSDT